MKAILAERYGPPEVLKLSDVPVPETKPDQVLIRVRAGTVTLGDCELRGMTVAKWARLPLRLMFGFTRPRRPILGAEIAGDIVAVGDKVTRFRPGDRVFGSTGFAMGTYAEFNCLKETAAITTIPEGMSYATAAGIAVGGLNGLHFVRETAVQEGDSVLINGAGGAIGTFATQIAKLRGAEVTAVDRGDKLGMLHALGADHVIDYRAEDFTRSGKSWDVIIDVVSVADFDACMACLNPDGRYFLGNPTFGQMLRAPSESRRNREGKRAIFRFAGEAVEDLDELKSLIANGKLRVPLDCSYPLEEVVEAHRYVQAGDKKGIVVIDVDNAKATGSA